MSTNTDEMVRRGWECDLRLLEVDGYQALFDYGDGELPVAIFGRVNDLDMVELTQGADMICFPAEDLEEVASAVMGMVMARRLEKEAADAA